MIRTSFKDDGPGIAREKLDKIFDPFFTTKEVGEGTGLGLSLSYGIVAEHNGQIYAKSMLGKGATFIVELPVVAEEKVPALAEEVVEPKRAPRARILVVDDEPAVLAFLKGVLTREGHQVDTADNAADGLEMVKGVRYRLIMLDVKMPGTSGIDLYEELEKITPSLARRVVFITGDVIEADTRGFLERTKALYITKPFDIEQLRKETNHLLLSGLYETRR